MVCEWEGERAEKSAWAAVLLREGKTKKMKPEMNRNYQERR